MSKPGLWPLLLSGSVMSLPCHHSIPILESPGSVGAEHARLIELGATATAALGAGCRRRHLLSCRQMGRSIISRDAHCVGLLT